MISGIYLSLGVICAALLALLIDAAGSARGSRGIFSATVLGLLILEILGYLDWRRNIQAPLPGYVLLVGIPTVLCSLAVAGTHSRVPRRATRIALAGAVWLLSAIAVFRWVWPRI